ncbi:inositol monophosphatase [Acidovorax sp. LjRoot118]|uniref:inositol monophosphatase family protein n=1 Tax=Acidovorax sp. LjRoot118 TaxID=3342256 RepID=UPI003ECE5C6E
MIDQVTELLRQTAAQAILPRYQALRAQDIVEKSPGELVTAADREAESLITAGLTALLPGSVVLGEEAVSAQAQLRERLAHDGDLWLVDPLDGTANFVAGQPCFAVMVALVRRGETVAAWMLDPLADRMHTAERGSGAWTDGVRAHTSHAAPGEEALRGAVFTRFLPQDLRTRTEARAGRIAQVLPGLRCAGHEYPAIAAGQQHFALFWRAESWDHAPGALFLTEAGGQVARLDGTGYTPVDVRPGLLAAQNPDTWDAVHRALLAP